MTTSQFNAKMNATFRMTGKEFASLMRRYKWTIRTLAARTGLTMKRIRHFRNNGICGGSLCDLYECITGALTAHMRACYRYYRIQGEFE